MSKRKIIRNEAGEKFEEIICPECKGSGTSWDPGHMGFPGEYVPCRQCGGNRTIFKKI